MAKKLKICSTCMFWKGCNSEKNPCSEIKVGTDVFISDYYLLTAVNFGCNKHKEKEIENDGNNDSISADSITD